MRPASACERPSEVRRRDPGLDSAALCLSVEDALQAVASLRHHRVFGGGGDGRTERSQRVLEPALPLERLRLLDASLHGVGEPLIVSALPLLGGLPRRSGGKSQVLQVATVRRHDLVLLFGFEGVQRFFEASQVEVGDAELKIG